MTVNIVTSNRIELLALELSSSLSRPLADPFNQEVIVVNSGGMESWLRRQLCTNLGFCGNIKFPFLSYFIDSLLSCHSDFVDYNALDYDFSRKRLLWRIFKILSAVKDEYSGEDGELWAPVTTYLSSGCHEELALYQLSGRLASLFDQYQLFRPDMLERWAKDQFSESRGDEWQQLLWKKLVDSSSFLPKNVLIAQLIKDVKRLDLKSIERISAFGISTMPPIYLTLFDELSKVVPITFYIQNPCREYWYDLLPERARERKEEEGRKKGISPTDLHYSKGHPLLISCGMVGQHFHQLLGIEDRETIERFAPGKSSSLLSLIQSNILCNVTYSASADDFNKTSISDTDNSVSIHSCHTILREVEVLRDQILDLFNRDSNLKPSDILVMAPDISNYSVEIEAVFSASNTNVFSAVNTELHMSGESHFEPHIPFTISDRSRAKESKLLSVLGQLLAMNVSRFEASVVLDILSLEAVASAFFIDISELGILSQWVEDNGVVWGWDLESRVNEDLPPYDSASWVRGLSRMVCGYAMGGALASVGTDTSLYFDSSTEGNGASSGTGLVVPYTEIDGDFSDLLGRFMNFLVSLKKLSSNLERARTLEDWQSFISVDVLTGFFVASNDDDEADLLYIQSSLEDLSQTDVGLVPAEVILDYFNESIGSSGNSSGFYRGKVTFCSLLPMRSIPAKIVCLLGMNLGEFPRQDRPSGFDLMARDFQPCDRSRRHDDRYLFLEAILAARERLYISYIGRSRDDNSLIAPSVLVDELKETVNNNFILPPLRPSLFDGHSLLFCEHEERLQPFSLDYFNGTSEDKFSYSVANFEGAAAIVARVHQRPFFSLPDDSQFVLPLTFIESTNKVNTREIHTSFDELLSFYKNPLLYLLKTGLDIAPLDLSSPETESNDEFPEDGLLQWKIRKIVFDHFVSNSSSSVEGRGVLSPEELKNQIHRYLFCSGRLSESHCHNLLFEKNYGKASTFASSPMPSSLDSVSVASLCSIGSPNYISLSIKIADITVHLSGICGLVAGNNLLSLRFGKRKFIDVIKTIIFHLAAQIEGLASEGTFFVYEKEPKGNPGEVTVDVFRKIDSDIARKHLLVILDWYCKGLQKPLPFIPYDDLFKKALTSLKKGEPFEKGLVSFTEPTNESIALCLGTTALGTCDELYGITLWFASLYLDLKEGV